MSNPENTALSDSRQRLSLGRVLAIGLVVACVLFLGQSVIQNWTTVQASLVDLDWGQFTIALFLFIVAWAVLPFPTYLTLRLMAGSLSYRQAVISFCAPQMTKYLPGGVWAIPGRVVLYQQRHAIKPAQGTFAVLWETVALLIGALFVGGVGTPLPEDMPLLPVALALMVGLLALVVFGLQQQRVWRFLARSTWLWPQKMAAHLNTIKTIPFHVFFLMTTGTILFWLFTGIAFGQLLDSLPGEPAAITWYHAAGVYALSWLIGFLVMVAPAGLGFRESALTVLLATWLEPGQAVFVAVLARLWWTLAEAVWIGAALLLMRYQRPFDESR